MKRSGEHLAKNKYNLTSKIQSYELTDYPEFDEVLYLRNYIDKHLKYQKGKPLDIEKLKMVVNITLAKDKLGIKAKRILRAKTLMSRGDKTGTVEPEANLQDLYDDIFEDDQDD